MSDQPQTPAPTEPTTPPENPPAETTTETVDVQALRADADKWKALSRKNEETAKKNAADAKAYREYLDSKKTEEERQADQSKKDQAARDSLVRENALLKLAVKHSLTEEDSAEIAELLEDVPADKFADRAEKLAARLAAANAAPAEEPGQAPDPTTGRETPPGGGTGTGDFLRDALRGVRYI